jgi:uncharacterized protein (TIGR00730 family)
VTEKKKTRRQLEDELVKSAAYRIAYKDIDFLNSDAARAVRLQTELMKADEILKAEKIHSTIVVFGGTRILEPAKAKAKVRRIEKQLTATPQSSELKRELKIAQTVIAKSHYYDDAQEFARIASSEALMYDDNQYVIVTGGGPGIMEAANRGAHQTGAKTVGMNITLPMEQAPNPYISPELCLQFHYFAIRKMHFLLRAKALLAFPGGYGTLDELFEALTLVQTKKVEPLPIVLFGEKFWKKLINFEYLVDEGTIDPEDVKLFRYSDDPRDAWQMIKNFYQKNGNSKS